MAVVVMRDRRERESDREEREQSSHAPPGSSRPIEDLFQTGTIDSEIAPLRRFTVAVLHRRINKNVEPTSSVERLRTRSRVLTYVESCARRSGGLHCDN